jgi:hypothetical protein
MLRDRVDRVISGDEKDMPSRDHVTNLPYFNVGSCASIALGRQRWEHSRKCGRRLAVGMTCDQ